MDETPPIESTPVALPSPFLVVRGTVVAGLLLSGVLMLCTPALAWNAAHELSNFSQLPFYGALGTLLYLVPTLANSWWIPRFVGLPPIGWFAAICNYCTFMLGIAVATAVLSESSFASGLTGGVLATLFLAPVVAVGTFASEAIRRLTSLSTPSAIWTGAIGLAAWIFILSQTH